MVYALALTQYHHTPAYRELWRETIARLIEKMMRWEVWGYWELTSRGSKVLDPELTKLGDGWIDPVIRQNVMYSGHLLMMVGLYEMLYRDGRYDRDGALTFQFRPVFRGLGPEDFPYDHTKLARVIYQEFERNDFLGCECEPNAIFVYCNQFPILGFKHYDLAHGGDYAERTIPRFREKWMKRSTMFKNDPETDLPIFYRLRQDDFIYEESQDNNEGITAVAWASVMHAWAKEYVELVYPRARDQIVRKAGEGMLNVNLDGYFQKYKDYQKNPGHHATDPMMVGVHIFGTLALAAAEVGDRKTLAGLLAYADHQMRPTWKNGGLFYPRNDDLGSDGYTTALVGNALLAAARLCPVDGFHALYNRPWGDQELHRPELCDVDYPKVQVVQADYGDGAVIRFALAPGEGSSPLQRVSVMGVGRHRPIEISIDGNIVLELRAGQDRAEAESVSIEVDVAADKIWIALPLDRERQVVLRQ
jgi:hypothetical protein